MRFKYLVRVLSPLEVEIIEGLEGHNPSDYDDVELVYADFHQEEEGYLDLLQAIDHKNNNKVFYLGKYVSEF